MRCALPFLALCSCALGCSYGAEDFCDDRCACIECSSSEEDECSEEADALYAEADDEGCTNEGDAYLECIGETETCVDGSFTFDCDAQEHALEDCIDRDLFRGRIVHRI